MIEWISVNERLPTIYKEVLVNAYYGVIIGYYDPKSETGWNWRGYRKKEVYFN